MSGGRSSRKRGRGLRTLLKILGFVLVFGMIGGILGSAFLFVWVSRDLPDPNKLINRQVQKSTKIWDRTGQHLLYEIHGDQKRTVIGLDQVAPVAIQATIASEDKNFYQHKGFLLQSFIRAAAMAVLKGESPKATSTITQQLVKNAILSPERTISRKIKELVLSYEIENRFSKDDILKMYLNEIPYGSTAYGIESAAQTFFGKSAKDLDASEAALLAALPKAPTRYSPYGSHKEDLIWWQRHILDTMVEQGYLTKDQAEAAKAVDIMSRIKPRRDAIFAPHFSLYVKEQLADKYGEREVEEGGLNVITTLDYDKQKFAEDAVTHGMDVVKKFGGSNAAMVALDPKTGQILAMVGSADYFDTEHDGNVNVVLQPRQPGSSFKPIVYSAAFEKGYTPNSTVFDVKTTFVTDDPNKPYEPNNYDLSEHGPVTMRSALAGSLNVPAVKTLYLVGVDNALDLAKKMGYSTFEDRSRFGLSIVLGGGEVKLLDHAAAYGILATEGAYHPPSSILKVQDADGKTLEEWKPQQTDGIIQTETARNITDILSDNNARAFIFGQTNYLTLPDRPVAAKTGTTNGFHDAWTLGYTPSLVAGVWVGNNNNDAMKNKADGSKVAAPIWNEFMKKALDGTQVEQFNKPQPIVTGKPVLDGAAGEVRVRIDKFTGKLATANTPETAVIVKTYRQAHDILYFVNKDDPRGPAPTDPSQDPQFANWEKGVQDWAVKNNWQTTENPPTETDDLHTGAFDPTVSIIEPANGANVDYRSFTAAVSAAAPRGVSRVEYYLEGELVATVSSPPWQAVIELPPTVMKGFYTLRAVAYDDIEDNSSQDININVTSDGVPLALNWIRPYGDETVGASRFPVILDSTLNDRFNVASVGMYAVSGTNTPIVIGDMTDLKSTGVSMSWDNAPPPAEYQLYAVVNLTTGEQKKFDGPTITVK